MTSAATIASQLAALQTRILAFENQLKAMMAERMSLQLQLRAVCTHKFVIDRSHSDPCGPRPYVCTHCGVERERQGQSPS
jgi:hypothetical protein